MYTYIIQKLISFYLYFWGNKRKSEVAYTYNNREYTIMFPKKTRKRKIIGILGDGVCCYDEVVKYLGPCENLHGNVLTPNDLGYTHILFEYGMDHPPYISSVEFSNDSVIKDTWNYPLLGIPKNPSKEQKRD